MLGRKSVVGLLFHKKPKPYYGVSAFCDCMLAFQASISACNSARSSSVRGCVLTASSSSKYNLKMSSGCFLSGFPMQNILAHILMRISWYFSMWRLRYPFTIRRASQNVMSYRNSRRDRPISPTNNWYRSLAVIRFFLHYLLFVCLLAHPWVYGRNWHAGQW